MVTLSGWTRVRLGDIGRCIRGVSYDPKNDLSISDSSTTVRLLRSNNVQQSRLRFDELQFVSESRVSNEQMLQRGDIVVCMANGSKSLVGKSGVFGWAETDRYTFGAFMGCFRTDRAKAVPLFVRYLFLTKEYEEYINNLLSGSAINNLAPSSIESLVFRFPSMSEQVAIAEALSDADSAIEALDALIAKKRDVKQAAMQQLLTGRTRLPGFSGSWSEVRFGDLCSPRNKRVDPRSEGGGDYCLELENLESGTGRLLGSTFTSMTSSLKTRFEAGDVLFGKLRSYLRKSWLAERSGVCSTEIWAFVARSEVARSDYLAQLVRTEAFIDATSMSYGTHMPRSDWTIVSKHLLVAPAIDEQSAIAQILGDMDEEIEALVAEREKLDLVKQGMMQELLTGRVRLV